MQKDSTPIIVMQKENSTPLIIGASLIAGGIILYYLYRQGLLVPPTPPTAPPTTPPTTPPPSCQEGEETCWGTDLYRCISGRWTLVEKNSSKCGVAPPIPPTPPPTPPTPPPPSTVTVRGITVETRGGQTFGPLPYVEINATNRDTGFVAKTVSDKNGRWEMKDLPLGYYDFVAMKEGYCTYYDRYRDLNTPGTFEMLPFALEKKTEEKLEFTSKKEVYSTSFTFSPPVYADRIEGYVIVNSAPTSIWRNVDIWIYSEGSKERVLQQGWIPPYPIPVLLKLEIGKTFRPRLVNKVSIWAGAGITADWKWPVLRGVNLVLKKQHPCY